MVFDPQVHKDRLVLIQVATVRRRLKGLPEEKNISILYKEICSILDLPLTEMSSGDANHFPAPHEMKNDQGNFTIPRRDCPQCGRKDGLSLKSICPSCDDSKGEDGTPGKYHTMYSCEEMGPEGKPIGCGLKTDKSEKFMAQRMSELNPDWAGGMKQDMGIKTVTDNGIK